MKRKKSKKTVKRSIGPKPWKDGIDGHHNAKSWPKRSPKGTYK